MIKKYLQQKQFYYINRSSKNCITHFCSINWSSIMTRRPSMMIEWPTCSPNHSITRWIIHLPIELNIIWSTPLSQQRKHRRPFSSTHSNRNQKIRFHSLSLYSFCALHYHLSHSFCALNHPENFSFQFPPKKKILPPPILLDQNCKYFSLFETYLLSFSLISESLASP